MTRYAAGKFDRRILVQAVFEKKDAAGDPVRSDWTDQARLWSQRLAKPGGQESAAAQGILRQYDTSWVVRTSPTTLAIAPETHRVMYKGRVYEIVGILEGRDREDVIHILTCARPDQRGSRGDEGASGDV